MEDNKTVVIDKVRYSLGECPFFDPRSGRLSWVDIINGRLLVLEESRVKTGFYLGQPIGAAVLLDGSDGFLLAARDGLYVYENGEARRVKDLTGIYKSYWRSNDAKADPAGRLWFGATADDGIHGPEGRLFCFDPSGGTVRCMQDGTKIANGMAWSSDRKSFYFSDSEEHAVFKYDYDEATGDISGRRVLFKVEQGVPDGLTIDTEDNLWVAIWGGNRVEKRDGRTGEKLLEIKLPAVQTSSCCFGGPDMDTLFITSAAVGQSGEYDGCLFACRVDARGPEPDHVKI